MVALTNPVICVDEKDDAVVLKAAQLLQQDIRRVTGKTPALQYRLPENRQAAIIIGNQQHSSLIRQLSASGRINTKALEGAWEAHQVIVAHSNNYPAIIITGSDRRGTAFGVFEFSRQLGVSPWYWWADVPVQQQTNVYVQPGNYHFDSPKIKYRGIFINDEAPALSGWVEEHYGKFNHEFYEKVFELLLRLKSNYIWPAMWGRAFYDDDTANKAMADQYGIVIGTSHHEPMMRAHDEWRRYGSGKWNFDSNAARLKDFWESGFKRTLGTERIVSIGMRGDGDEPMTQGTAIKLLEDIVSTQRDIIQEVSGKPASETPQSWALYKEVQDYYDKGMRVPDDVTLLLCDDNWGNIRKLPKPGSAKRTGGYGVYYHFDYVGGPRNYKWINTNPIARVWEQMHLAYEYGVEDIWIVNVGDIKPMEFPISFFLDYAYNPEKWRADNLDDFTRQWAAEQFGKQYAGQIASIITRYSMYNGRRKPELLTPATYSLQHYREAERVLNDYKALHEQAVNIGEQLPKASQDAYYQLVLHPVEASANLYNLYVTTARNWWYAEQGRAATNALADSVKILFEKDSLISHYYNKIMANGKWNHMMDQTHIGYTYWQQPRYNSMPKVNTIELPGSAEMGVAIEGSKNYWPQEKGNAELPVRYAYDKQQRYVEIFNRGSKSFQYSITVPVKWLQASHPSGTIDQQQRIWLKVDWARVPAGKHTVPVTINGPDNKVTVMATVDNSSASNMKGFIESNGYIAIEAAHYTRAVANKPFQWEVIPELGKTASGVQLFPVNKPADTVTITGNPHLEYDIWLRDTGSIDIGLWCSPTLDFLNQGGLRFGVSIDDSEIQVINLHEGNVDRLWNQWVADNIIQKHFKTSISKPGHHVLKYYAIDPGLVLQKIVIDAGGLKPSYLGPEESPKM